MSSVTKISYRDKSCFRVMTCGWWVPGGVPPVPHCVQCSPKKPNYDPVDAVWPVWPVSRDPGPCKSSGPGKLGLVTAGARHSPALLRVSPRGENMGSGRPGGPGQARLRTQADLVHSSDFRNMWKSGNL